ncbi:MAG: hypothetical protein C0503_00780 [Gemmatimonas sp.]|nr:hypothetical protein [Gemmatimonas sp.]
MGARAREGRLMHSDHDIIGTRVRVDQTEGLGLFDAARTQAAAPPAPPRRVSRVKAAADEPSDRDDAIARLKDLIVEALVRRALDRRDRAENPGVTADDVLALCRQHPQSALVASGKRDEQRAWSWVGPWLAQLDRAGALAELHLSGQKVYRRSTRPSSHGNLQVVYVHPTDHRARRRAA